MDEALEKILASRPEQVRERALAVDEVLMERVPGLYREIDAPGGMVGYMLAPGYRGTLFTLLLSKAGVKVGFAHGAALPDPAGLLTGRGKTHRHVPILSVDDLQNPALIALIDAAFHAWRERTA